MKNKIAVMFLLFMTMFCMTGCIKKNVEPNLDQLREISDWITLEAEYHNVAKVEKDAGSGIFHLGEVDRKLWVEYVGIIKVGVEADKIDMTIKDNKVRIDMPKPSILFINYKDYNSDSYYVSKDSWFNKNKLNYKDMNDAMEEADKKMLDEVNKNHKLFDEAQNNLEVLMTNYINKIGDMNGKKYEIEFIYK